VVQEGADGEPRTGVFRWIGINKKTGGERATTTKGMRRVLKVMKLGKSEGGEQALRK